MTSALDMTAATTPCEAEARSALTAAWHAERDAAKTARRTGDAPAAWSHLERAHILSQPFAGLHLRTPRRHARRLGPPPRPRRDRRPAAAPPACRARLDQRSLPGRQH